MKTTPALLWDVIKLKVSYLDGPKRPPYRINITRLRTQGAES